MGSPPTSSLRFLTSGGVALDSPPEWKPCLVELTVPEAHWTDAVLRRNGDPLRVGLRELDGVVRVVAEWTRTSTGSFELELDCPPADVRERRVVDVRPSKLSDEALTRMLFDLELRLPASIAVGLSRLGGLSGIELLPPAPSTLAQELLRVRRAVRGHDGRPGLRLVLEELADDPHRHLLARSQWTPREHARRIDPARLPQILVRGGNLDAEGNPARVPETRVEHTTDNYENRLLRTFHDQLAQHVRRLLKTVPSRSHPAARELRELAQELSSGRRRASFLSGVGKLPHAPDRVTMVLLERAPYRAAFEGFLEFRRSSAVRLHEPALEAPLQHLHYLYQTWGVLQVIDVTLEQACANGFQLHADRLTVRHRSGLYVQLLRGGEPAVELRRDDGSEIRVTPQRSYRDKGPLSSVSHTQIPDVALEVERPDREPAVLVFDPKYKLSADAGSDGADDGRPVKSDIDAMHAYRDAIRDDDGRHAVRYAAIMYPGPDVDYGPGLAALRAQPLDPEPLRRSLADAIGSCLGGDGPPLPRR